MLHPRARRGSRFDRSSAAADVAGDCLRDRLRDAGLILEVEPAAVERLCPDVGLVADADQVRDDTETALVALHLAQDDELCPEPPPHRLQVAWREGEPQRRGVADDTEAGKTLGGRQADDRR